MRSKHFASLHLKKNFFAKGKSQLRRVAKIGFADGHDFILNPLCEKSAFADPHVNLKLVIKRLRRPPAKDDLDQNGNRDFSAR